MYPLSRVKDLLWSLAGWKAFSKLDLEHAYQQVILNDEAKEMVTIHTHNGLTRVNHLPFGVASAPHCSSELWRTLSKVCLECLFILMTFWS